MPNVSGLTRAQLDAIARGDPRIIKALELLFANNAADIPAQIAALQVLTQVFTATSDGIVPHAGVGSTAFLRGDASWSHQTDYLNLTNGYTRSSPVTGDMWTDGNASLNFQATSGVTAQLGRDNYIYCKASSVIALGQLCYFTGVVGASGVITAAPAASGITVPSYLIGIAAENIALNGFGLIQVLGDIKGFDTTGSAYGETWADGDILYYNATAGGMTNIYPTSGVIVTVAAVTHAGSGGSGSLIVRPTITQRVTAGQGITVSQTSSGSTVSASLTGYTVATLPAGTLGMRTYVTDAAAPAFGAIVVGGGSVKIPVFFNGTNWVAG